MNAKTTKKKKGKNKKINKKGLLIGFLVFIFVCVILSLSAYSYLKNQRIDLHGKEKTYLYIPTHSSFQGVVDSLVKYKYIQDEAFFSWLARRKGYVNSVKAGRYELKNKMGINTLLNHLKTGKQVPVQLVIQKSRTKGIFAGKIAQKLEVDSTELYSLLNDPLFLGQYQVSPENALTLFIPNTYEFYWNTNAEAFIKRMYKENQAFWNQDRLEKAQKLGLSPSDIVILASIVEEETIKNSEKPIVASVYLNRLRRGMKLQADPTVKFAVQDFGIRRILFKHLEKDSPYNTYIYEGLPPGPICIPNVSSIDAVLENKETDYLYFCAKDDFSGYHSFASTSTEHMRNARKYHQALTQRKITQ